MKSLSRLFALIGILFASFATAQTGDSCLNSYDLGIKLDTCTPYYTVQRPSSWFTFTGMAPQVTITLTNSSQHVQDFDRLVLYSGTCGSLTPIDSIDKNPGDSVIVFTRNFLPVAVQYFIQAKQITAVGCRDCDIVTSNLCLKQEGGSPFCGFDFTNAFTQSNNPGYTIQMTAQDQYIFNYVHSHSQIAGPFTIPVVVHVLHFGDAYGSGNNITYDQILWQIAGLNAAFQHDYAAYNQEGYGHNYQVIGPQDYSSNPQVRFCLATIGRDSALNQIPFFYNTMSGDTECGIVRYDLTQAPYNSIPNVGTLNEFQIDTNAIDEQVLMNVTRPGTEFPNGMYFNIYLVPDICSGAGCDNVSSPTPSVVGIGTMVASPIAGLDGVVFRSDVFGDNSVTGNTYPLFPVLDQGKIMDHEAGHYLGLYHTFQPDSGFTNVGCYGNQDSTATSNQCDENGDFCCDTPPDTHAVVLPFMPVSFLNTCNETYFTTNGPDHRDMNENYMDYSDDEWYNTFTFSQSMRISAMLDTLGPRHSLVTPNNLALTGVSNTGSCHCCILAAHIVPQNDSTCPGAAVSMFTPSGVGFCANSWTWQFPGGSPSTATGTNTSVTYNTPGTYWVYLTATDGTDTVLDSALIHVVVPTVHIVRTNTTDTVCDATPQNIYLLFSGGLQPYNVTICDQNNNIVQVMNNIFCDSAIVLLPVTTTSNVFHICSATNGLGCDLDTTGSGTASFNVIDCCPNLFKDGTFEDYVVPSCNIFPSTTDHICGAYQNTHYWTYDPSTSSNFWPAVPGNNGVNGLSMVFDGYPAPLDSSQATLHTELWSQAVPLEQGVHYSLQFDYSGHHWNLASTLPHPSAFGRHLWLQFKVNGTFIGTPIHVPDCSPGTPWHTFVMDYVNPNPTGTDTIALCQVVVPNSGVNFNGNYFDFLIDNMTIRAMDIPFANAGSDTLICPGGVAIIGSLLNDTDGVYTWLPNNWVACDTCFYTTANPDNTYEYVLMNQQNGCIVRDTVVVTVLHVSLGNDTAFCGNGSITLIPTVTGNAGSLTYLWQPGAQTTSSITVSPTSPTTYIVTVTDTVSGCSDSDTLVVSPNNLNVSLSDTTICGGDTITLSPLVTGNIGGVSYLWLPGNQTTTTISVSPLVTTTYTVIVNDTAGCSDTAFAIVTPDNISVTFSGSVLCAGDSTTLTASVTNGFPAFTYLWQPGSQTTSSITVSPSATTIYTLTVTDSIGCTATFQDTVTLNNLSVSLSNAVNCNGDSATLSPTITGGFPTFTYLWQPGSQTTSTITVAPSSTTTYTLIVTDANGCSDTALATVTPSNLSVTLGNKTICSGQSTTLSPSITGGNPTFSYLWLPTNDTTATIGVVPSTTTSYTVIVTDATGCSDTATATVTVNPAPTVTASATPNPPCLGSFVQLQATATGTGTIGYVWQPTTNLNNPNTANPTITSFNGTTITYTVFITDALGCSAADSVTLVLDPNCCSGQQYAGDTLSSNVTGGIMAVNQNLVVVGTVTISGAELRMAPNVSITVTTGSILIINSQSWLHACLRMWQGIIVQPGAQLIITGSSLVEDAFVAVKYVNAPGANVQLVNAIFNKNQIAVLAQTWTGTLAFNMQNCRVTCRTLPASPTVGSLTPAALTALPQATMLLPLNTQRSFSGVQFQNGGSITVGQPIVNGTNIFDYLDHGIVGSNANLNSRNNHFQNMLQPCTGPPGCPTTAGIGISVTDPTMIPGNASTYNSITVGGGGLLANTFLNCWRSVDITRYVTVNVTNNTIFSSATVISPPNLTNLNGDHGIFIRTTYSLVMNVNNNVVRNQARGIHIVLAAGGLGYNTINVRDNVVKAGTSATTFTSSGIQVEGITGVFFVTNNFLNIEGDSVLNANVCIQVRNIRNAVRIFSNPEIRVRPNTTTTPGPNKAGIFVQNCQAVLIQDNLNIHSTGTVLDSNNRNIRGIYVFNSNEPVVCNNATRRFGQCMVFEGSCANAVIRKNDFSFCYDGFVLRNSAVIGQQGDPLHPIDCRWLGGFVFSQTFVDQTFLVNTNSPIYVRGTGTWYPTNNQSSPPLNQYSPIIVSPGYTPAACGPTPPLMANQQALRQRIAQNQVPYAVFPTENRVANQKRLYKEIDDDPALMVGDTVLQNFYANNQYDNLGLIDEVDDETEQGNSSGAISSNNGINALTNPEWNQQQFNAIFLATIMQGNDSLTIQQLADLTAIAEQCPNEGGDAVWQSRAMLDWVLHTALDYSDSCTGASARFAAQDNADQHHLSRVFPNPNAGAVTVEYQLPEVKVATFEVLDLTGRVIFTTSLDPKTSQQMVELPGIANGPYIYKIIGDGELKDTGTLIISR